MIFPKQIPGWFQLWIIYVSPKTFEDLLYKLKWSDFNTDSQTT